MVMPKGLSCSCVKLLAKAAVVEHSTGESVLKMAHHMAVDRRSQFLAGCWQEASVPCQVVFFQQLRECPQNMASGCPQVTNSRKRSGISDVFHDLASEVTHHHFHSILLAPQVSRIQCERGPQRSLYQEFGIVGAILSAIEVV